MNTKAKQTNWQDRLHEVIYEADTPAGRVFDILLLWGIMISVIVVALESVRGIRLRYGDVLWVLEWFFTILFTVEYILRILSVRRPFKYAFSFYGIIDLLSFMPTYIALIHPHTRFLILIRVLRLMRVFRVLKLVRYNNAAKSLLMALRASRPKITVFLGAVLSLVAVVGTLMYVIEGEENGFTSIPRSAYWAIVTLTTVGYGDIAPQTALGQLLASLVMLMGYGIIAVPTGIVSAEFVRYNNTVSTQACPVCSAEGHDPDAVHCKFCGAHL